MGPVARSLFAGLRGTLRAALSRAAVPDGAAVTAGEAVAGGWGARPGLAGVRSVAGDPSLYGRGL